MEQSGKVWEAKTKLSTKDLTPFSTKDLTPFLTPFPYPQFEKLPFLNVFPALGAAEPRPRIDFLARAV